MDVQTAIKTRRTVYDYRDAPISRAEMEQILESAIWAPNHKLTNPWEFYAFSGQAKERLARLRGELKRSKFGDLTSERAAKSYQNAYRQLAEAPYAVLVCQRLTDDPVRLEEDLLAIGCAIQNMMLTAQSLGIGTFWGTGPLLNHPETFATLGVPEGQRAVGLVILGRPAQDVPVPPRAPLSSRVTWIE